MFQKIDILIDNPDSWIWQYLERLKCEIENFTKNLRVFEKSSEIESGDILFILSCDKILKQNKFKKHKNNIVIHASDLPKGRGWNPWSWEIESGANFLTLTLFEADSEVDSGSWYLKDRINLDGKELINDIRKKIVTKEIEMIVEYLSKYPMESNLQSGEKTFYSKRSRKDQELNVDKSINEQFNKLRVCDNERYPAHFYIEDSSGGGGKDLLSKYIENNDQFIYMKRLKWDSEFFKRESFLLDIGKSNFVPDSSLITLLDSEFKNTFISVKINSSISSEYIDFIQNCNFKNVGAEITLQHDNRKINQVDNKYSIREVSENKNIPYASLGSIFNHTRFHSDINIDNEKADLLWIEYLRNYKPSKRRKMFLTYDDNTVIGVILVNIEPALNEAALFYVAVMPSYQSKGVGKSMMNYVLNYLQKANVSVIKTETQLKNINALNYYINSGFSTINNTSSVWHRWS